MGIEQLLRDGAERFGAKVAIVAGRHHHSYADLHIKTARLAAALTARGVRRGARVAVFMDNTCEAVVSTFAILRSGGVVCPVDPALTPEALAGVMNREKAVALCTEARLASSAAAAMREAPGVRVVVLAGGDRAPSHAGCISFEEVVGGIGKVGEPAEAGEPGDTAFVLAGATAAAEPEILTHGDLIAAAAVSETPREAVVVASLPIASHYGLYQMLTALAAGATQVLAGTATFRDAVFTHADSLQAAARLALAG